MAEEKTSLEGKVCGFIAPDPKILKLAIDLRPPLQRFHPPPQSPGGPNFGRFLTDKQPEVSVPRPFTPFFNLGGAGTTSPLSFRQTSSE